jgi:hypothetical protein
MNVNFIQIENGNLFTTDVWLEDKKIGSASSNNSKTSRNLAFKNAYDFLLKNN